MVIYGTIWYQGKQHRILIYSIESPNNFIVHVGEQNFHYNRDKYACSFSKLISYWRQIWNERTNGITNLQFPFGFVQVSFIRIDRQMD
jgi:hypothetical protein